MQDRFRDDPNVAMLRQVAAALGELCDELVFVGGCAAGLLVTRVRAEAVRVTRDVDAVAEVFSAQEYHALEARLEEKGFVPDQSFDAPICRRVREGVRLDVMPSALDVLGFHNRWYPEVVASAVPVSLGGDVTIRLVSASVFIASKLEAFRGRGQGDYLASHDLEDLLTVVDGRDTLPDEIAKAPRQMRRYIAEQLSAFLHDAEFRAALPGHLPADAGAQARLPELIERLERIAAME